MILNELKATVSWTILKKKFLSVRGLSANILYVHCVILDKCSFIYSTT